MKLREITKNNVSSPCLQGFQRFSSNTSKAQKNWMCAHHLFTTTACNFRVNIIANIHYCGIATSTVRRWQTRLQDRKSAQTPTSRIINIFRQALAPARDVHSSSVVPPRLRPLHRARKGTLRPRDTKEMPSGSGKHRQRCS